VTESREHTALEELKFNTTGSIPSLGSIVVSQKPFDEIETERRADADAWFHQKSAYPLHPRRGDRRDKKEEAR
jgi:hypothetical protein